MCKLLPNQTLAEMIWITKKVEKSGANPVFQPCIGNFENQ
jgi:hypothetical protein